MIWTNEKIMDGLQEHYNDLIKQVPEEQIFGVFLQGSQNYGLAYERSDIDTKAFVFPSLQELCLGSNPKNTLFVRVNDEHIEIKDIRLLPDLLRKENPSYLELFCTKYFIVNPAYSEELKWLQEHINEIPKYDEVRFLHAIAGTVAQKYHALEQPYPSKLDLIKEWGYDPKQLHHMFRLNGFLDRVLSGIPLKECYYEKDEDWRQFLIEVKDGKFSLTDARNYAETINKVVKQKIDDAVFLGGLATEDNCMDEVKKLIANMVHKSIVNEIKERG